jgi:phosphohistidine phosphatase
MKTLLLLRHAKSSWDDTKLHDFDRPLSDRGRRAAPRMGKAFAERGLIPDLIVSSPAVRAKQTVEAFITGAGLDAPLKFDGSIYDASSAELMRLIRELTDSRKTVLLVGHNPGFEETLARLTGAYERMPTAALACIELLVDRWEDVEDSSGRLAWFLTPKLLKQGSEVERGDYE